MLHRRLRSRRRPARDHRTRAPSTRGRYASVGRRWPPLRGAATTSSTPAPAGCTASTCSAAMISVSGSVAVSPSDASCTVTATMAPVSMSTPCSALWAKCVLELIQFRAQVTAFAGAGVVSAWAPPECRSRRLAPTGRRRATGDRRHGHAEPPRNRRREHRRMDRPDVEPHGGRRGRGRGRVLFDLRPVRLEQVDRHLTRRSAARRAVLGALGGQPSARQPVRRCTHRVSPAPGAGAAREPLRAKVACTAGLS